MKVISINEFVELYLSEYNGSNMLSLDFIDKKMYGDLLDYFLSNCDNSQLYKLIKDIYFYRFKGMKTPQSYAYNYVVEEFNPNRKSSRYLTKIGELYYDGDVVKQDYKKAFIYFLKDESRNSPNTLYYLGYMYYSGLGTTVDYDKAFYYLSLSSKANYHMAYKWLGYCYFDGLGTNQNHEEAFVLFQKALSSPLYNKRDVKYYVGLCFENGYGVEKNFGKAIEFYYDSLEEGYSPASKKIKSLGFGENVSFDIAETKYQEMTYINQITSDGEFVLLPKVTHVGYEIKLVRDRQIEGDYHHFKTTEIPAVYEYIEKELVISENIKKIFIQNDINFSAKTTEFLKNKNILIEKI